MLRTCRDFYLSELQEPAPGGGGRSDSGDVGGQLGDNNKHCDLRGCASPPIGRLPPPPRLRRRAVSRRPGVVPRPPPPTETIDNAQRCHRLHLIRRDTPVSFARRPRISDGFPINFPAARHKPLCAQIFAKTSKTDALKLKFLDTEAFPRGIILVYRMRDCWAIYQDILVHVGISRLDIQFRDNCVQCGAYFILNTGCTDPNRPGTVSKSTSYDTTQECRRNGSLFYFHSD